MPAPKTRAIKVSRTKPKIRETKVMLPTLASALSKFMLYRYNSDEEKVNINNILRNFNTPIVARYYLQQYLHHFNLQYIYKIAMIMGFEF